MNNYFNLKIPFFQENYGTDWTDFQDIMEEYIDDLYDGTFGMYKLIDINRMLDVIVKHQLDILEIWYNKNTTASGRRQLLRNHPITYRNKGMRIQYRNIIYSVTALEPDFYIGSDYAWRWEDEDTGRWGHMKFGEHGNRFIVMIDVKTTDSTMLDDIVSILSDKTNKVAFYIILLIDSSFTVYRRIG